MKYDEKDPAKRILALEAKIQRQRSELKSKQLRIIDLEGCVNFYRREWDRLKGGEECVELIKGRARIAQLETELAEARKDNDELDGTDAAHPAWWRGNDAGVSQVCAKINAILDGADVFVTASEPWESTRRRVAEARKDSERMRWILCNCELVHAGKLRNGNPVYFESLEELDAARGTE